MRLRAVALCALLASCSRQQELLPLGDAGPSDAGGSCSGLGPFIELGTDAVARCAGATAAASHRFALCVCAGIEAEQPIRSEAYDSTGLTGAGDTTAAIGVRGDITATAAVDVGGALWASGGATLSGGFSTTESLRLGGALTAANDGQVGTDAYVSGDLSGDVSVAGVLHVPETASVDLGVSATSVVREAVVVPDPCGCSSSIVDVPAAISAAQSRNDDATAGISVDTLAGDATPASIDLPCGTFFVNAIDLTADLRLNVHGRAALAVLGDARVRGTLDVTLDAGAELDLLVGGQLAVSGGKTVGTRAAPARFRIWTVSTSSILFEDAPIVGAVVYAPRAEIVAPAGLELYGSVFAAGFSAEAATRFHYDRAVLSAGVSCGSPAQPAIH